MRHELSAPRRQRAPEFVPQTGVKYTKKMLIEAVRSQAELLVREGRLSQTKQFIQHSDLSVYQHCCHVAYMSCLLSNKLRLAVNYRELIRGALLHDYYLYDWHKRKKHPDFQHAFGHPSRALRNALEDYDLTEREMQIIQRHMWPLTIIPPTCTEAWVIVLADKICTVLEVFRKECVKL